MALFKPAARCGLCHWARDMSELRRKPRHTRGRTPWPSADAARLAAWTAAYNLTISLTTGGDGSLSVYLDNEIGYAGYRIGLGDGGELWHVRHRDYLPAAGVWTRRDPIGYADGMNLYQYVGSWPMLAIDPMGLHCHLTNNCGGGGSSGGGGGRNTAGGTAALSLGRDLYHARGTKCKPGMTRFDGQQSCYCIDTRETVACPNCFTPETKCGKFMATWDFSSGFCRCASTGCRTQCPPSEDRSRKRTQDESESDKKKKKRRRGILGKLDIAACLSDAATGYQSCLSSEEARRNTCLKRAQGFRDNDLREEYEKACHSDYNTGVAKCTAEYAADALQCLVGM